MKISTFLGLHNDPFPFNKEYKKLGHAFYPLNQKGLAGDIHLNEEMVGDKTDADLHWLITHMIGKGILACSSTFSLIRITYTHYLIKYINFLSGSHELKIFYAKLYRYVHYSSILS